MKCYECKYRRDLWQHAHSACVHPERENLTLDVNQRGIDGGWFDFPVNFDPFWLKECNGFTLKETEK